LGRTVEYFLHHWKTCAGTDIQSTDAMLDAKLMKLFLEIIRSLHDQDVLAEDTILHWFRKKEQITKEGMQFL
jgi:hypothetical protein